MTRAAPLRIGILGCGKQAPKHLSGLKGLADVEVVLADLEPERAEALARAEGVAWAPSVEAVLADPTVAAVSVCTPTPSHAPLVRAAIAVGKHYCCEKPLAETREEAAAIAAATAERGLFGMVGFIYRFAPNLRLARELVARGMAEPDASPLGRPRTALFRIGGRGSHAAWKHQKASGGGAINEMLVHVLDLAAWWFPEPIELSTVACRTLRPTRRIGGVEVACDAEDYVLVQGRTASGVELVLQADLTSPAFVQHLELHGDEGSLMASIGPEIPSFLFTDTTGRGFAKGRTELPPAGGNLYLGQMAALVEGARGGEAAGAPRVAESLRLLDALELVRKGGGKLAGAG